MLGEVDDRRPPAEGRDDGQPQRLLLHARSPTGELLVGKPFTATKWAREIGKDGKPIVLSQGVVPPGGSEATTPCVPDLRGGTVFNPPSFDPSLQLFFVMARETCAYYTPFRSRSWQTGRS